MANIFSATIDGPESFKATRIMRNQPVAFLSLKVTRRVLVAPAIKAPGAGTAPPTSGQIWPRGSKA